MTNSELLYMRLSESVKGKYICTLDDVRSACDATATWVRSDDETVCEYCKNVLDERERQNLVGAYGFTFEDIPPSRRGWFCCAGTECISLATRMRSDDTALCDSCDSPDDGPDENYVLESEHDVAQQENRSQVYTCDYATRGVVVHGSAGDGIAPLLRTLADELERRCGTTSWPISITVEYDGESYDLSVRALIRTEEENE